MNYKNISCNINSFLCCSTMAFSVSPKPKLFILTFVFLATFSCCYSGYAADNPAETLAKALLCFNNKFIYTDSCEEAYRLNESGNLNVPLEATDLFCGGPCLTETQFVLNCVDRVLSKFTFDNKATVRDIRTALNTGCSYTSQRGNFDLERYMQGETSGGEKALNFSSSYAFAILTGVYFSIL